MERGNEEASVKVDSALLPFHALTHGHSHQRRTTMGTLEQQQQQRRSAQVDSDQRPE